MYKITLTDGSPVTDDHKELLPNGQQKGYVVLSEEERKKGFTRPVRQSYVHVGFEPEMDGTVLIKNGRNGCGALTKMSLPLAETYARNPKFYSGTFCVGCRTHRTVAEFYWDGTNEVVGS